MGWRRRRGHGGGGLAAHPHKGAQTSGAWHALTPCGAVRRAQTYCGQLKTWFKTELEPFKTN